MGRLPVPLCLSLVVLLLGFSPGAGQQGWVERASYTFLGNRLAIDVLAEVPGELLVLRGRSGRLEIRAASEGGLAAFGFQDRGSPRLSLTGLGGDRVTYLVVLPARTRVTIRLPGRQAPEGLGTLERSGTFRWERPDEG